MKNKDVENFVRKYADLVYRVAFTILKNEQNAEDVFQEVFLKVCKDNINFLSETHEKAWLIRVTKNQSLDLIKKCDNKPKEELNEEIIGEHIDNENSYILEEVMKLPDKLRIILHLFYFEGYKINEISTILEENESTIKSRLVKAREVLKMNLKEEF